MDSSARVDGVFICVKTLIAVWGYGKMMILR